MKHLVLLLAALILASGDGLAQFRDQGLGGGIGFGQTFGQTELRDRTGKFHARAFLRYGIVEHLQGEFGVGLGRVGGVQFTTQIIPVDYRFVVSPFSFESWNPFLYAGFGALHFDAEKLPPNPTAGAKEKGWTGYAPGGLGLQFRLDDNAILELSGGYNYTLTDDLNGVLLEEKDAFFNYQIGLTVAGESPNADPDGDGLTNREEKELGTDKKRADSDGDGLTDGQEVKQHSTNPLSADSDGDGLGDGEEVNRTLTSPVSADTDGDGLRDGEEITTRKTDPNKADTDGDGLKDGDEITQHRTDPLRMDTDGDGLKDGDEVTQHRTDPLKMDTDGGTVDDGTEIARGTDPRAASDDIPKREVLQAEVGKAIVLEGIVFATGKAVIGSESEVILEKAFNTLAENPEIAVEIRGHTDATGKKSFNLRLSQARADAVKAWLVKKGIAGDRITARGFGPDSPIAPNDTPEGRQQNRRIEFFRTR
ncbi:MAG: OmpA family protein [Bacteroidota bacterium]